MSTGSTIAVVAGLIIVAGFIAYAVTRAPAPTFMAPAPAAQPATLGNARPRQSGLGEALGVLNTLAATGAGLLTQTGASKNSTGLSAAIGGQK